MKKTKPKHQLFQNISALLLTCSFSLLLFSCATVDPARVDVDLKKTPPRAKITSFTQALSDIGLMTEIYGTEAKIMVKEIIDKTGASGSTGGEIQRDITEIMKSTLNSMGGTVTYIPYDPVFMQNTAATGYTDFANKIIPEVVITGGITEFDRGLETRGQGNDASASAEFTGLPDWLPSKEAGIKYSDGEKYNVARITVDFNMIDFQTMSGISKMTATNTMEVVKAMANKEIGILIFGPTFGRKGSIKRVQGRHEAIRLLVQLSMIQIVGKYLGLPYWRLLGDDARPDPAVSDKLKRFFYRLSEPQRIANLQQWLFLHGHNVPINGVMDNQTSTALTQVAGSPAVTVQAFERVYTTIPITHATLGRRNQIKAGQQNQASYQQQQQQQQAAAKQQAAAQAAARKKANQEAAARQRANQEATARRKAQQKAAAEREAQEQALARQRAAEQAAAQQRAAEQAAARQREEEQRQATPEETTTATPETMKSTTPQKKAKVGRRLSEDEW
jgi:flagellar biosynthesis GTPase FlhF